MSLELSKNALEIKPSSTLAITAKAKEMKSMGMDIVGFGAGEADFDTPLHIRTAAKRAVNDGFTRYTPASGTTELKEVISRKFHDFNHIDYAPDQIVICNGGKHALSNTFKAILNPGEEVMIPAPFWLSYPEMVKLADGVPVIIYCKKENNYKVTVDELEAAFTPKTKALIINSPNNPTGMIYSRKELEAIADFAKEKDIFVVSDEIYENLCYGNEEPVSIASLNKDIYKRTITVNGLAKSYAMTGWRIGYLGASKKIASVIGALQSHETGNPNSVAQKAAVAALAGDQTCVREMNQKFDKRRKAIYKRLLNCKYLSTIEPQGAFYAFVDASGLIGRKYKGEKIRSAAQIADYLLEDYCVAVVPCADFGFPDHFRLSYAISTSQINKGLDRIEAFCNATTD